MYNIHVFSVSSYVAPSGILTGKTKCFIIIVFHQNMLEQIATSEKVFDVSKANKVTSANS